MTLAGLILATLAQRGPLSRPALEAAAAAAGYAPISVGQLLWTLCRAGRVRHVRRASRHRCSLYELS